MKRIILVILLFLIVGVVCVFVFIPREQIESYTGPLDYLYDQIENLTGTSISPKVETPPDYPGLPAKSSGGVVIEHSYFTMNYVEKYEQSDWVMYTLNKATIDQPGLPRKENFREDTTIVTGSASLKDYQGSGYDRGHLVPAEDMKWSSTAMSETFFMSNISPQVSGFNRGIWKKLEEQVRDWAIENEEIYVVTGPVLKGNMRTIGRNQVAIPKQYYKVILDYQEPERKGIGFVLPNKKQTGSLNKFAVSIDAVEDITGIDFFPNLKGNLEKELEGNFNLKLWPMGK